MGPAPLAARSPTADLLDRFGALERACVRELVAAAPRSAREALGLRTVALDPDHDAVVCARSGHLFFNRVLGRGLADAAAIDRALTALRCDRPDNFFAVLDCAAAEAAEPRGLVRFRRDNAVLVHDGSTPSHEPTAHRLERADRRHLAAVAAIFAEAFALPQELALAVAHAIERPAWHGFVALDGDTPVAVALLFVLDRAAYFAGAATRTSARGRGLHDALIARRISVARALGARELFVDTGSPVDGEPSPSLDNLVRAGFTVAAVRPQWAAAGSTWTGER